MSSMILILGVLAVLISLVMLGMVYMKSREVNLLEKTDEKPEWMQTAPPHETIAATMADDEGVTLYDHDEGEAIAAPFAEQIEDVLRAKIANDPNFKSVEIDFGTAPDGGLDIWVNGTKYNGVANIPDERLKQALLEAVKDWNSRK